MEKFDPSKREPKPTDRIAGRSPQVVDWLKRAGILSEEDTRLTKRVVIDIDVESVVKVYIERMGTRQMLMVEPINLSRNIVVVDKPDEEDGDASAVA